LAMIVQKDQFLIKLPFIKYLDNLNNLYKNQ